MNKLSQSQSPQGHLRFVGDTQIKALDDINFSVEKGEFVAIIGPSGSGKSTLLHVLGGVDTPTSQNA